MIKANSFSAEEIFDKQQLMDFVNTSNQMIKTEFGSIYYGACFTVCIDIPVHARYS